MRRRSRGNTSTAWVCVRCYPTSSMRCASPSTSRQVSGHDRPPWSDRPWGLPRSGAVQATCPLRSSLFRSRSKSSPVMSLPSSASFSTAASTTSFGVLPSFLTLFPDGRGTRIYFRRFWDARDLTWTRAWTPVPLAAAPFGTGVPQLCPYKRDATSLPAHPGARPFPPLLSPGLVPGRAIEPGLCWMWPNAGTGIGRDRVGHCRAER